MNIPKVKYRSLGLTPYQAGWDLQTQLFNQVLENKMARRNNADIEPLHYLLTCEHPHTYTLGRNGDENHLLANPAYLEELQATFVKINRGGDITYHGFGQLVAYPILDLDCFFSDVGRYIRYLEETVMRVCGHYGIKTERIDGFSGVWIDAETPKARKIAAVGVHLSRWITMHGLAFNVNTDLSYFNHIVPCGIVDKQVTSLQKELGYNLNFEEVERLFCHYFSEVYQCGLIDDHN